MHAAVVSPAFRSILLHGGSVICLLPSDLTLYIPHLQASNRGKTVCRWDTCKTPVSSCLPVVKILEDWRQETVDVRTQPWVQDGVWDRKKDVDRTARWVSFAFSRWQKNKRHFGWTYLCHLTKMLAWKCWWVCVIFIGVILFIFKFLFLSVFEWLSFSEGDNLCLSLLFTAAIYLCLPSAAAFSLCKWYLFVTILQFM